MSKFYITTPIYYVNDVPHIGHAYTTIAADAAARFHRLAGSDVFFATGTDEHGLNIERVAKAHGVAPQEWSDRISAAFRGLWSHLNIAYDDFIRTTEPRHERVVRSIFERLHENGDIYKGTYEGWYCSSCESFYPEGELGPERTCPIHTARPVEWNAEACYLFRLSLYQDWILSHIERHPSFVEPEAQRNEVLSFVRSGLRDIAVSRSTFKWGVPLPFDPSQVAYVWIDALINYISAIGYGDDPERFRRFWPAEVHLVGRDILRFHAVIWPIVLHAAGLEPPRQVYAHGFLTFGGQKFSKSLGIILDPVAVARELAEASGADTDVAVDALRYFLLREVPFGADGDFNRPALIGRFNADLANDYGNLLNRTLPLVTRYFEGVLPAPGTAEGGDEALRTLARSVVDAVLEHIGGLRFSQALSEIWRLLGAANKYLDSEAPWTAVKQGRRDRAGTILYNTLETLRVVTILVSPVLPTAAGRVWDQLGVEAPLADQRLDDARRWGGLRAGLRVLPATPIFPRIETKPQPAAQPAEPGGARQEKSATTEVAAVADVVSIEEFKRMDIRIGQVKTAERVPGTDKLIKIEVEIGGEVRTIVSGIAPGYQAEGLVGRRIVVLANLQPRKVRGIESRGMLLAATWGDDEVALLGVDGDPPVGSGVS